MLGRVLGRYIKGGVTFKGALLFSIYGIINVCRLQAPGSPQLSVLSFQGAFHGRALGWLITNCMLTLS